MSVREARVEFRPEDTAPAMGRRVLDAFADAIPLASLADARLLLTELMTNAIRYGGLGLGDVIRVCLVVEGDELSVEVEDPGRGFEARAEPGSPAGTGWGLFLLEQIASRWGADARPGGGSIIWFRLPLRPA
jgi:signal transduction histidine kinase